MRVGCGIYAAARAVICALRYGVIGNLAAVHVQRSSRIDLHAAADARARPRFVAGDLHAAVHIETARHIEKRGRRINPVRRVGIPRLYIGIFPEDKTQVIVRRGLRPLCAAVKNKFVRTLGKHVRSRRAAAETYRSVRPINRRAVPAFDDCSAEG